MEIIAAVIIYTLAEGIKENNARMDDLQAQIVDINNDFLTLSGAHSALSAQHKVEYESNREKIDGVLDVLDTFAEAE